MTDTAAPSGDQFRAVEDEEPKGPILKPLTDEQIAMAKELIDDIHPIYFTHYDVCFPLLCYPCGVYRKNLKKSDEELAHEKRQLLEVKELHKSNTPEARKMLRMRKKKAQERELFLHELGTRDPFTVYGYGMTAYRTMLKTMAIAFWVFSIFSLPCMFIFMQGGVLAESDADYVTTSLGNLGFAKPVCTSTTLMYDVMTLACDYGVMTSVYDDAADLGLGIGLNPYESESPDACLVDETLYQNEICSQYIDQTAFLKLFVDNCLYAESCSIDLDDSGFLLGAPGTDTDDDCLNDEASFFVQYTCEVDEATLHSKYNQLSVVTALVLFISFSYSLLIYQLQANSKLEAHKFDMNTITAGDFTVEMLIDRNMWGEIQMEYENDSEASRYSPALWLKKDLKKKVEKLLKANLEQKLHKDPRHFDAGPKPGAHHKKRHHKEEQKKDDHDDVVKIIEIQFAYDNHELIEKLRLRGTAILNLKTDEIAKYDQEINDMVKNEDYYDKLTRPVVAFITFQSDDGYNEACAYEKKSLLNYKKYTGDGNVKETIYGRAPEFEAATDPTNIIWENRHIRGPHYCARVSSSLLIIGLMLVTSFTFIYLLQESSLNAESIFAYPDCEVYYASLTDDAESTADEKFLRYAGIEWDKMGYYDWGVQMSGSLECWCDDQIAELGYTSAMSMEYTYTSSQGEEETFAICDEYIWLWLIATATSYSVEYIIIAINYILKYFIIVIITWVGYQTQSNQLRQITASIITSYIFNTAFLTTIACANLKEQADWLSSFDAVSSDFDQYWYEHAGSTLISTLMVNIYYFIGLEFCYKAMRMAFILMDSYGCEEGHTTKKITLYQYVNLHSGPEYFIYAKYGSICLCVFCAMIFGAGCPALFIASAAVLSVFYLLEKFELYYVFRAPPSYDEKLNDYALHLLSYAPLTLLIFAYWQLSNHQLLQNYDYLQPLGLSSEAFQAGHMWWEPFHWVGFMDSGPAGWLLFFFYAYLIYLFAHRFTLWCSAHLCKRCMLEEIEIDEDIDVYQNCLDDDDKEWTLAEERNMRSNFGIQTMLQESKDLIAGGKMKTKDMHLVGIHTYDLLRNEVYKKDFQYFAADLEDREEYIIDGDDNEENDCAQSDMVRVVLNLAFMTGAQVSDMEFNADHLTKMKKAVTLN